MIIIRLIVFILLLAILIMGVDGFQWIITAYLYVLLEVFKREKRG